MYKYIYEGDTKLLVPKDEKVSKEMPVFYNPAMELNRDVSVALLKAIKKEFQVGLPLAGTGARAVRFLTELNNIKSIEINDMNEKAIEIIKRNIEMNEDELKCKDITVSKMDANQFLLESKGFDYIDLDPFGPPIQFLDSAVKRMARKGILAVTATDTGALSGTFTTACKRKYWAKPLRNELMHETGLRILIRRVQLIGAQGEKALIPILSYSKEHYMRVFFLCDKGRQKADEIIKEHKYLLYCPKCLDRKISKYNNEKCSCKNQYEYAGPLWTGPLNDKKMLKNVKTHLTSEILSKESNTPFFYDIHKFASKLKLKSPPKKEDVLKAVKKKDKTASFTHFNHNGIKTNIETKEFVRIIQ